MGTDPTDYTAGYLDEGEIPNFRILDVSTGAVYDAVLNGVQGAFGDCSGYPNSTCNTFPAFSNFSLTLSSKSHLPHLISLPLSIYQA